MTAETPRAAVVSTPPRAGRNLTQAIWVSLGLFALVGLSLIRKEGFVVVVVVAICGGLWELTTALARIRMRPPLVPLLFGGVGIIVSAFLAGPEAQFVAFLLTVGGIVVWRVLESGGEPALRETIAGAFAASYLPFMAGFVMLMLRPEDGVQRVVLFILTATASDIGGYAVGVLIGQHKLAPKVSPNKTWEGLAGSVVLSSVVAVIMVQWLFDAKPIIGVVLAAGTVATAMLGDLSESLIKRDLGLKDMGSLLPGHGGILDRIDSMLMAAPVSYLMLAALIPVVV